MDTLLSLRRLQAGEGGKYILSNGRFIKISDKVSLPNYVFFPRQKRTINGMFHDKALGRWFKTKSERREYMHINGFREDGDLPDMPDSYKGDIDTDLLQRKENIKFELSEKTSHILDKAFEKKNKGRNKNEK